MGAKNLAGFRSDLEFGLGDRGFAKGKLNGWINAGYFDITGAFDFEELHETSRNPFIVDQEDVTLPTDLQWLRSVHNDTDKESLTNIDEDNFWLLEDKTDGGIPEQWTRIGNSLRIWPKTDKARTIRINYNKFPVVLAASKDVTTLTPTWDRGVELFSMHHALMSVGEEARASEFLARGMTYVRSRLLQQEMKRGPKEGVRIPRTRAELRQITRVTRDGSS